MRTIKEIREENNIVINEASEAKGDHLAKYDPRDKDKSKALISKIPPKIGRAHV